jgi:CrcB protein
MRILTSCDHHGLEIGEQLGQSISSGAGPSFDNLVADNNQLSGGCFLPISSSLQLVVKQTCPMMFPPDFMLVALGAMMGAVLRAELGKVAVHARITPWQIAGVNVAGSFTLGVITSHSAVTHRQRTLLGVGFCGALTTFSAFSVDTIKLLEADRIGEAAGFVALNNAGSIGAAWGGMKLGKSF